MDLTVTLDLPEEVVSTANQLAEHTERRIEDIFAEWIDQAAINVPVELYCARS